MITFNYRRKLCRHFSLVCCRRLLGGLVFVSNIVKPLEWSWALSDSFFLRFPICFWPDQWFLKLLFLLLKNEARITIPFTNPPCIYMVSTSQQRQPMTVLAESPTSLLVWQISGQHKSKSPRASASPARCTSAVENSFAWHHALCYTKPISWKCHFCKFGEEEEAALLSQTTPGALGTPGRQKWLSVNFPACLLVSVTHVHPSPAQTVARACGTTSSWGLRSTSVTAQYMNKCNRKPRSD